jgi:glycosyltransferase involved in cell wall biosynthesis
VTASTPQVTVLIPCFNTAPYLTATLESVRAQTHADFEVIMVDDGSTDGTAQIMRRLEREDPRFSALLLGRNQGVVAARNAGLARARGTYVAFLDGDDIWTPDALAVRLALAAQFPRADVIATDFAWFEAELPVEPVVGRVGLGPRARQAFAESFDSGKPMLLEQPFDLVATLHFAWTGAMLIRRQALTAAGNFDPTFVGPEDTLLWLRLAQRGAFAFCPQVTAFYRQRSGSLVTTYLGPKELHYLTVLARLGQEQMPADQRATLRRLSAECNHVAALHFRRRGAHKNALKHAIAASAYGPLSFAHWNNLVAAMADYVLGRLGFTAKRHDGAS